MENNLLIIENDDRPFEEWFDHICSSITNLDKVLEKYGLEYVECPYCYYVDDDNGNLACLIYGKLINDIVEIQKMVFDKRALELSSSMIHIFLKAFIYRKISDTIIFETNKEVFLYNDKFYKDFDYKIEKQDNGTYLHKWTYINKYNL